MIYGLNRLLRGGVGAAFGLALFAAAPTTKADCKAAAIAHVNSLAVNVTVAEARFVTQAKPDGDPLRADAACVAGKKCRAVFLATGDIATTAAPNAKGRPVAQAWKKVPTTVPGCTNLIDYHLDAAAPAAPAVVPAAPAVVPAAPAPPPADIKAFADSQASLLNAKTADEALVALAHARPYYVSPSAPGAAQGAFDDAAAEGLQILGQIVVDRASAKGYALLKTRLERAFGCPASTHFGKTCALLDALRIQDIAMAPEALAKALAEDLLKVVTPNIVKAAGAVARPPRADDADRLRAAVFKLALSLVTKSSAARSVALHDAISQLTLYATTLPNGTPIAKLTPAQQAAVRGALTFARCVAKNAEGTSQGLGRCNVEAELDQLPRDKATKPEDDPARPAALALAQQLVTIGAAEKASLSAIQLAVDTVGATACMVLTNAADPELKCSPVEALETFDEPAKVAFTVAFADALLEKDAATFIVVASKLVELKWPEEKDRPNKRSALRLMTGLLSYAATYAQADDETNDDAKHAERTKILESLTKDMTDRNGRGGDCIWSLAGALRAEGGVRIATRGKGTTFQGPIGLPLGVAFDTVPESSTGWGFHLQLDAVNLGNYLALDNEPKVKKPDLGDAFAPGLTIGAGYGQDLPVVLGAYFSYTPQFKLDSDDAEARGSINVGATVGIHVPLIDMN